MQHSSIVRFLMAAGLAFLTSCAPMPRKILRIEPLDTSAIRWVQGIPHMTSTVDQVRLELAFKALTPEGLEFSLAATNRGPKTFDFDPRKLRMASRLQVDSSPQPVEVEDPPVDAQARSGALESSLHDLARESNPHGPPSFAGVLLGGAFSILTRTVPTPEEEKKREARRREDAAEWDRDQRSKMERTRADLEWWKVRTLLRNSLDSGATISGSILFRMRPKADTFGICVPVRDTLVSFPFSQRILTLPPTPPAGPTVFQ